MKYDQSRDQDQRKMLIGFGADLRTKIYKFPVIDERRNIMINVKCWMYLKTDTKVTKWRKATMKRNSRRSSAGGDQKTTAKLA
jgi:hypothetical protein